LQRRESYHTGCFIGLDLEYGDAYYDIFGSYDLEGTNTIINGTKDSSAAFPVSVNVGYQWFKNRYGVRVKGYLGYVYYGTNIDTTISPEPQGSTGSNTINISTHSLHYGLSASFMWNWINSYKHTFGFNSGFGFEGKSFVKASADSGSESGVNETVAQVSGGAMGLDLKSGFAMTIIVGIHYIINTKHQLFLNYKYSGFRNLTAPMQEGGVTMAEFKLQPHSRLMLGYAYKF